MRAAMIHEKSGAPVVGRLEEPKVSDGHVVVEVEVGAIGPTDLMRSEGVWRPWTGPHVPSGEGVGRLDDGSRVYFGHSVPPYGAWGERTLVKSDEVWPAPEGVSNEQVAALTISGTGSLVALEQAAIQAGERVLMLGATGVLGQISLQLMRHMGAGVIVAAGRNAATLEKIKARGLADLTVQIGQGDDLGALKAVAGDGWDLVLDGLFGKPAEAALKTTRMGGRMISVGRLAGPSMNLDLQDLGFKSIAAVGTGIRPPAERRAAYERLMAIAAAGKLKVDVMRYALDQAPEAWAAQKASPNAKILMGF